MDSCTQQVVHIHMYVRLPVRFLLLCTYLELHMYILLHTHIHICTIRCIHTSLLMGMEEHISVLNLSSELAWRLILASGPSAVCLWYMKIKVGS